MNEPSKAKVYVVEDEPCSREMIAKVLRHEGYEVVTYDNATDFLDECTPATRGCIVLDEYLPGLAGSLIHEELRKRHVLAPIIFVSASMDFITAIRAMRRGAIDWILKPIDWNILIKRVNHAMQLDARLAKKYMLNGITNQRLLQLSPREGEVLELLITGQPNKQIARGLKISERTVEIHRSRVMSKMQAGSFAELVTQVEQLRHHEELVIH